MSRLKIAVIVDNGHVQRFGLEALDTLEGCDEITVFSCTNTRTSKKPIRHAAYYLLNLWAIRNRYTRMCPVLQTTKRIAELVEFASGYEGNWQTLPPSIIDKLASGNFDLIIKLGMGLLRVPPQDLLNVRILSWHHGDPDSYRGRPAGFWEMMHGANVMGQIIQVLSNRLDGGQVVAFAETKVYPHSYRSTLIEAMKHSQHIINHAVRNALSEDYLEKASSGPNYRLPSNIAVSKLVFRMAGAFIRRLIYGALFEKRWKVSITQWSNIEGLLAGSCFPAIGTWKTLKPHRPYTFYADPFFSSNPPGVFVEAMNGYNGLGELVLIEKGDQRTVFRGSGHCSYPMTTVIGDRHVTVAETATWSKPLLLKLQKEELLIEQPLLLERPRGVIDPTLIERDGRIYLFGNCSQTGTQVLSLWSAESLDSVFRLHPRSPIRVSAKGSRMAGNLFEFGDKLLRFGQDNSGAYGEGIFVFEVTELSEMSYRERQIGQIRFQDRKGPHTINFAGPHMTFDWYHDRFSLLAGARRLAAKLRSWRPQRQLASAL